jgi:hypothetical protein
MKQHGGGVGVRTARWKQILWGVPLFLMALATSLLLSGQFSWSESLTGVGLAALSTIWWLRVATASDYGFARTHGLARTWLKAAASLPMAVVRTGGVLLRGVATGRSPGRAQQADFDYGPVGDPQARTRRAGAILSASLAPDSFVVRIRPGHRVELHALGEAAPRDPQWLL